MTIVEWRKGICGLAVLAWLMTPAAAQEAPQGDTVEQAPVKILTAEEKRKIDEQNKLEAFCANPKNKVAVACGGTGESAGG